MRLSKKVILITGSTKGIGQAIAKACVAEDAKVMLHGLEEDLAQNLVAELGENADYVLGDVSDPKRCEKIVQLTWEKFGRLDGIVNNAGIMERGDLESTDARTFDRIINVNLRAPLLITREALKYFRETGGGVVLNIGSTNALSGEPNQLVYSVAKGGLMTMTRNLGNSLSTYNIRVIQLNVGWTLTESERERKRAEGMSDGWEQRIPPVYAPRGSLLTPDEVANHAVFWLSDAAAPANGVVYELEQYPLIGRQSVKGE